MPEVAPKKFLEPLRRLGMLILRVYLLILVPLAYFQRSLIYHPHRCERLEAKDSGLLQAVVDVTVKSHDGLELHGWLAMSGTSPGTDSVDVKQILALGKPVVLFFPGNAGDRSMRSAQITALNSLNAHVVIVDYRGYGDNKGRPSELSFARDARSVWNHLTQELGIAPRQIVVYGESLGGGVATRLASELCQAGIEPGGLIVQSTFSSLVDAGQAHFPIIPVSLLLIDRFPSDQRIPHVTCPILQIHGSRDSIVSLGIGQKLFDAAPAKSSSGIPKRQVIMPNTDHNDVYYSPKDRLILASGLEEFFEDVKSQPVPSSKSTASNPLPNNVDEQPIDIDWTIVISVLLVAVVVLIWWTERVRSKK